MRRKPAMLVSGVATAFAVMLVVGLVFSPRGTTATAASTAMPVQGSAQGSASTAQVAALQAQVQAYQAHLQQAKGQLQAVRCCSATGVRTESSRCRAREVGAGARVATAEAMRAAMHRGLWAA